MQAIRVRLGAVFVADNLASSNCALVISNCRLRFSCLVRSSSSSEKMVGGEILSPILAFVVFLDFFLGRAPCVEPISCFSIRRVRLSKSYSKSGSLAIAFVKERWLLEKSIIK